MKFIIKGNIHLGFLGDYPNMVVFTIKESNKGWLVNCKLPARPEHFGPYPSLKIAREESQAILDDWLKECQLIQLS